MERIRPLQSTLSIDDINHLIHYRKEKKKRCTISHLITLSWKIHFLAIPFQENTVQFQRVLYFTMEGKLYLAFSYLNWHFWRKTQVFAKSLKSKTDKNQISEQTRLIWVRWSLCSWSSTRSGTKASCDHVSDDLLLSNKHLWNSFKENVTFSFLSDPGVPGVWSMGPVVTHSLHTRGFAYLTDVTLAGEDINSTPADDVNRAIQGNVAMQVAPPGGQKWN